MKVHDYYIICMSYVAYNMDNQFACCMKVHVHDNYIICIAYTCNCMGMDLHELYVA